MIIVYFDLYSNGKNVKNKRKYKNTKNYYLNRFQDSLIIRLHCPELGYYIMRGMFFVMKTQNKVRPFGMRDKLAYAAGDLGCNMSFGLKGTVQTFWLVYMMMETGLFSVLLVLVQAWDAINAPIIGSLIDRDNRKYKIGKYKQYIFLGACGLLIGGAAVFVPLNP